VNDGYSSAGAAHRLRTCSQSASSGDSAGAMYRAPGKARAGGVKLVTRACPERRSTSSRVRGGRGIVWGVVSQRELVVLGTASQAPTRTRNHNGYFLRWDDEGLLFDPGEGTQRQMLFAGVTASQITRICITHFHGDHCLGLPGVLARMSLDRVPHQVVVCYPAGSREVFGRLRHASLFRDVLDLRERRVRGAEAVIGTSPFRLEARALSHSAPTVGYRLTEPDGRRMLPDRLAALGIAGPDVGRLQREGRLEAGGRMVMVEQVSEPRPGQRFAFVMDTRLCDAAFALADRADLLVCESTFANAEAGLARDYGHLTAGQAGQIAAQAGVRRLVLTHFSQRYEHGPEGDQRLAGEAAAVFGGEVVLARDLDRIPVPPRRGPAVS
jgi:ribonuclease Z